MENNDLSGLVQDGKAPTEARVETPELQKPSGILVPITLRDLSGRTMTVQAPSGVPEIMVGLNPGFGAFRFVKTEDVDQNLQRIYQQQ